MATPVLGNFAVVNKESFALDPPKYIDNLVLVAGTAQTVTIPSVANVKANFAVFAATSNIWVDYLFASDTLDLIVNGNFTVSTGWTAGTGWVIAAGVATATATSATLAQSPTNIVQGRAYLVTYTVSSYSAGSVTATIGNTSGTARSANGTYTETIIAGSGSTITLTGSTFAGVIDNVSMTQVALMPLASNTTGAGVELNPQVRYVQNLTSMSVISEANTRASVAFYI